MLAIKESYCVNLDACFVPGPAYSPTVRYALRAHTAASP